MSEIDTDRAKTISANLKLIMDKADLTIDGLEAYARISRPTISRTLLMYSNISPNKLKKLAEAFNLKSKELTEKVPVRTRHIHQIEALTTFRNDNKSNFKFFNSESRSHNVQAFVEKELLNDSYYRSEHRVKEIKERLRTSDHFKKEFTDTALEQAIKRIAAEGGPFKVFRKSPGGRVFYYIVEKNG